MGIWMTVLGLAFLIGFLAEFCSLKLKKLFPLAFAGVFFAIIVQVAFGGVSLLSWQSVFPCLVVVGGLAVGQVFFNVTSNPTSKE